jgi:hypothetical protein
MDNITLDLGERDWIDMAQDKDEWRAFVLVLE